MPIKSGIPLRTEQIADPDVKQRRQNISAQQILNYARQYDRKWAPWVRVIRAKKMTDDFDRTVFRFETITVHPNTPPNRSHYCTVRPADMLYKGPVSKAPSVIVGCDCLVATTRVLTENGYKYIYELTDPSKNPIKDFPIKYNVNGKLYKGSVPFLKGKQPTWTLTLENGSSITVTKDHKIRVLLKVGSKKGKYCKVFGWKKVKNLKISDKICLHTINDFDKCEKDTNYWNSYFVGAFHGDGTFSPFSMEVHSHKDILSNITKDGIEANLIPCRIGTYALNQRAREILFKYNVSKENRHNIDLQNINIFAYLSGLIDTDGYIRKDGGVIITGSKNLEKVADKLKELGVAGTRFGLYRIKGTKTNYVASKDSYYLKIGIGGIRDISKNLCSVKYDKFISTYNKPTRNYENVSKISSIKYHGPTYVYDIHVPKIHRFVAESMIVHNCERYMFVYEYANWYRGAGFLERSNKEYPIVTNPSLRPGGCKHLYHGITRLIATGH